MKKIVQQKINQDYMPISHEYLSVGSVVAFDCYVKRFNGYVIVVEAGTLVTQELHDKLFKEKNIYIAREDRQIYKEYCTANAPQKHETVEEPATAEPVVQACSNLAATLAETHDTREKFSHVYASSRALMQAYYLSDDEQLPLDCVNKYIDVMVGQVLHNKNVFSSLSKLMPKAYSYESHLVNVSILAALIGKDLALSKEDLCRVTLAGLLHDIGKKSIPKKILDKDGPLEADEYKIMQEHPRYSTELLKKNSIDDPQVIAAVIFHHERLDGSGYPRGLKGSKITKYAQIIAICDVFDALTTERTFRARYSSFDALMLMKRQMTQQLNQEYVDVLIRLLHQ